MFCTESVLCVLNYVCTFAIVLYIFVLQFSCSVQVLPCHILLTSLASIETLLRQCTDRYHCHAVEGKLMTYLRVEFNRVDLTLSAMQCTLLCLNTAAYLCKKQTRRLTLVAGTESGLRAQQWRKLRP